MFPPISPLQQSCSDYWQYLDSIRRPARAELDTDIDSRQAKLHGAFSANLFIAHAINHIQTVRKTDGAKEYRSYLARQFDQLFSIEAPARAIVKSSSSASSKMHSNTSELPPKRYQCLEQNYSPISFQSLFEENGRVPCILDGFRFDSAQVVLRPEYETLVTWDFETVEDILEFSPVNVSTSICSADDELMASDDPAHAIDQIIIACNPTCEHCREAEDACYCANFIFEGEQGRFEPRFRSDYDFDSVISKISGAYSETKLRRGLTRTNLTQIEP